MVTRTRIYVALYVQRVTCLVPNRRRFVLMVQWRHCARQRVTCNNIALCSIPGLKIENAEVILFPESSQVFQLSFKVHFTMPSYFLLWQPFESYTPFCLFLFKEFALLSKPETSDAEHRPATEWHHLQKNAPTFRWEVGLDFTANMSIDTAVFLK
jgi:hypothetical protein